MSGKRKARDRNRTQTAKPEVLNTEAEAGAQRKNRGLLVLSVVAVLLGSALFFESPLSTLKLDSGALTDAIPDPDTTGMEPRVATAISKARNAVVESPESSTAWAQFAFVLDAHGLMEYAEPAYRRTIALDPGNFLYTYNFAAMLTVVGRDLDRSLKMFRTFARANPEYAAAQVRIGEVLELQGEIGQAAKAYHRATELDPEFAYAQRSLGQARLILDNCSGAVAALERAVRLAPNDSLTLGTLAQAYSCSGDEARAVAAGKRAAKLGTEMPYPDPVRYKAMSFGVSHDSALDRAAVLKREGDYAGALRELKLIAAARPNSANTQDSLAEIYRLLGDEDSARKHGDRARILRANRARLEK